uniref:Uncharacterized protein n=1 Tax=Oryza punctata TaxID=4537 RepID=A0A0E0JD06_ORYPU
MELVTRFNEELENYLSCYQNVVLVMH